ncbi:MAG: hypothetical protein IKV27_00195 [Lachnospiraceae bacterium]|nr:hypothetical protein [Lachnospiraceae bacterium]
MDTFMDKLAEKLNAEEIIQANRSADIDQKIQKKQQEELAVLQVEFDKIQNEFEAIRENIGKLQKIVETQHAGTNDHVHKENVKVYRNVQAVVVDEAAKQAEGIRLLSETVESMKAESAAAVAVKKTPGILKGILGISIVTMLMTAGLVAYQVLLYFGIV